MAQWSLGCRYPQLLKLFNLVIQCAKVQLLYVWLDAIEEPICEDAFLMGAQPSTGTLNLGSLRSRRVL